MHLMTTAVCGKDMQLLSMHNIYNNQVHLLNYDVPENFDCIKTKMELKNEEFMD